MDNIVVDGELLERRTTISTESGRPDNQWRSVCQRLWRGPRSDHAMLCQVLHQETEALPIRRHLQTPPSGMTATGRHQPKSLCEQ